MTPLTVWLTTFLSARGERDGRELFRYRCSAEEYEKLRKLLAATVRSDGSEPEAQSYWSGFVLYASEWFRREFDGGNWGWAELREGVGLAADPDRSAFYAGLELGFAFWKRPLIVRGSDREFLWTAVREGGLPLRLIAADGDRSLHVSQILTHLVEESLLRPGEDLLPAARGRAASLYIPDFLKNDAILSQLSALARWLSRQAQTLSDDEMELLESAAELPFLLDDPDSGRLLAKWRSEGRVVAERVEARPVGTSLLLTRTAGGWHLERRLAVPKRTTLPLLGLSADVGTTARLYVEDSKGNRERVCDVTPSTTFHGLLATSFDKREFRLPHSFVDGPLFLVLAAGGRDLGRAPFAPPPSQPWIFAPDEDAWKLVGEGSRRSRLPRLLVLVDRTVAFESEAGACRVLTEQLHGRRLLEVTGRVRLVADEDVFEVSACASEEDEDGRYVVVGGTTTLGSLHAFEGAPRVMFEQNGTRRVVAEVTWRPFGLSARALDGGSRGAGYLIVHGENGVVRFRQHLDIVSTGVGVHLRLNAQRGCLEVKGLPKGAAVHVDGGASMRGADGATTIDLRLDDPRQELEVVVSWPDRARTCFKVPFPRESRFFQHADGRRLAQDACVAVERLGRLSAIVLKPGNKQDIFLKGTFQPGTGGAEQERVWTTSMKVPMESPGAYRVGLRTLRSEVRIAFAASLSHEDRVRLTLPGQPHQRLLVSKYDGALAPVEDADAVELKENATDATAPALLEVCVQRLWDPSSEWMRLEPDASRPATWRLPAGLSSGPWLVAAFDGEVCRHRPLLMTFPRGAVSTALPEGVLPGTLAAAACEGDHAERTRLLEDALARLGGDRNATDWPLLQAYLRTLGRLPETTYDVLRKLAKQPATLALAVLKADKTTRRATLEGMERLLFAWHLVPVDAWENAVVAHEKTLEEKHLRRRQLLADNGFPAEPPRVASNDWKVLLGEVTAASKAAGAGLETALRSTGYLEGPATTTGPELLGIIWQGALEQLNASEGLAPLASLDPLRARVFDCSSESMRFLSPAGPVAPRHVPYRLAPRLAALVAHLGMPCTKGEVFDLMTARLVHPESFDLTYQLILGSLRS